jgi:aspartate aminotransferase
MQLSRRVLSMTGSATLELSAQVAELRARGVEVISLGAGEPDFPTPPEAIAAATAFIGRGRVIYTPACGLPELRAAAAAELSRSAGVPYQPSQVVITNGAKEGLVLAMLALCQQGDEVLVPTPAWVSYDAIAAIADARMVGLPCDDRDGFKLKPGQLRAAIGPRTRALVLNSPNNPTGAVYSRAELAGLAEVLRGTDVAVISDEIYSPFSYAGEHVSPASLPGMAGRTVVVNGVSKSHSMTGWRLGFVGAPPEIADAISHLKSHLSSNAAAPSQHAALGALRGGEGFTVRMRAAFAARLQLAIEALEAMPGLQLVRPAGAFYVFPRVDGFYGASVADSAAMCRQLLEQQRVAALPGAAFGDDRFIRFSIAAADDQLAEGLRRFALYLDTLRAPAAARVAPR